MTQSVAPGEVQPTMRGTMRQENQEDVVLVGFSEPIACWRSCIQSADTGC